MPKKQLPQEPPDEYYQALADDYFEEEERREKQNAKILNHPLVILADGVAERVEHTAVPEMLTSKRFRISDTGESYRTINHWSEEGLLSEAGRKDKSWRSFSVMDLVWMALLRELRDFGFSLTKIKALKRRFFMSRPVPESNLTVTQYFVLAALFRTHVDVYVLKDGRAKWTIRRTGKSFPPPYKSYLTVNINGIVQRIFDKSELLPKYEEAEQLLTLSEDEQKLLAEVRSGKYEKVTVTFRNGRVERIDGREKVDPRKRLYEIIQEANYQRIEFVVDGGNVRSINRTKQQKVLS